MDKHLHKRVEHIKSKRKYDYWKIAAVVFGVLFVASLLTKGFSSSAAALPKDKASEKALAFINTNLLQGQAVAVVESIQELKGQSCLYNLTLNINGNKFDSFITKDASFIFPQGINMNQQAAQQQPSSEIPKADKPEVLLFTMSYCPYGNQAEDGIVPVVKAMGKDIDVQPHYVIYANYKGGGPQYCLDKESKYCSMHGIQEVNEDVRELCIYKYEKAKFWDFIIDVNTECNSGNVDTCWENVAKAWKIDTAKISTCQKNEALTLLAKEVELNTKYSVQGSPMLIINGGEYSGARTPEAYKTGICSGFNTPPAGCSQQLSSQGAATTGNC